MHEINSIELLLHLYDAQYNRYNSFKEKININLALSSGIIAIFSFLFPTFYINVCAFIHLTTNDQLWNLFHLLFLFITLFIVLFFVSIYLHILIQSSIALTPIVINLIDYEAIDLQTNGKYEQAYRTAIKDLKYTIERNKSMVNCLYEKLIHLQDCFLVFIALTIEIVLSVVIMCLV